MYRNRDKDIQDKNSTKVEMRKKSEQIEKLNEEIIVLKETHKNELDRRQKTLDAVSNQNCSLKKEVTQHLQKIDLTEEKIKVTSAEITKLAAKNKELTEENKAHLEYIKTHLKDPKSTDQFQNMMDELEQLRGTIEERDKQIRVMQTNTSVEDGKSLPKTKK